MMDITKKTRRTEMCGNYAGQSERWRKGREQQISLTFNKFAGKSVNPADPNDPVLEEMRQAATQFYSKLQLVPAGVVRPYIGGNNGPLVNAELIPASDGSWRIGNSFHAG